MKNTLLMVAGVTLLICVSRPLASHDALRTMRAGAAVAVAVAPASASGHGQVHSGAGEAPSGGGGEAFLRVWPMEALCAIIAVGGLALVRRISASTLS